MFLMQTTCVRCTAFTRGRTGTTFAVYTCRSEVSRLKSAGDEFVIELNALLVELWRLSINIFIPI